MNFKKAGDKNLARDHNQMIREIKRLQSKVSDSVWSHPFTGNNQVLPLTIKRGTSVDKFKIIPGTVNNLTPTLGGVALDNATPPEFTVTADTWVYIKCVGTFGSPDTYAVTIHTETTDTPPSEAVSGTAFTSYDIIGMVDFTSGSPDTFDINNYSSGGNLGVESFGAVNIWYKK